jgi:FAD/FMN-containing dehydrogenase
VDELAISRNNVETPRLLRLSRDDSRTTISAENVASLQASLKQRIEGEVRFHKGSRALYATDGSNYRQVPIGVVIPRHVQDVETTVRLARAHGAPVADNDG